MDAKFPLIHVLSDNLIYGVRTEKEFRKASLRLIKTFDDSIVIDSNGVLFQITKAYQTGWGTLFWGYHPFIKGRLIQIDFEVKSTKNVALNEIKNVLLERVKKKYSKAIYFFASKNELQAKISNANNLRDLIGLFIYDNSNN